MDYSDLSYRSNNIFFRTGFNKTIFPPTTRKDWDIVCIGLRYAVGLIQRGQASYLIKDSIWGTHSGTIPAQNKTAHWFEITGGVSVELFHGLFAGWNVRGKFLVNQKAFQELPPSFIAGYGKGDNNSNFDFNFYLSYAIRWGVPKDK
jgi:hypothetical protein